MAVADRSELITKVSGVLAKYDWQPLAEQIVDALSEPTWADCVACAAATTFGRPADGIALTLREVQVLRMADLGFTNRDIARQLHLSVHTVKNHVHNVLQKLGAASRGEAAAIYRAQKAG